MAYYETIEDYWAEENEYLDSLPPRYTVCWTGYLYEGDDDDFNTLSTDSWDDAISIYNSLSVEERKDVGMYIRDNHYDVTLSSEGDWW